MAPSKGTDRQTFRLAAADWREFGEATTTAGTDRATELRAFVQWYLRKPGAKMPKRPEGTGHTEGT